MKYEILFPRKRKFKTENAFRAWQNEAIEEENKKQLEIQKNAIRKTLIDGAKSASLSKNSEFTEDISSVKKVNRQVTTYIVYYNQFKGTDNSRESRKPPILQAIYL